MHCCYDQLHITHVAIDGQFATVFCSLPFTVYLTSAIKLNFMNFTAAPARKPSVQQQQMLGHTVVG